MAFPDEFRLDGQVAVVTGGGRGIGEAIAHALSEAGTAVVLAARRADEVEKVARDIAARGGRALAVPTDVTDPDAVDALARAAVDAFGGLTIWVNNAGGSRYFGPLREITLADWRDCLDLNLTAVLTGTNAAARHMAGGGSIVNISSRSAVGPAPGSGHYAAAKAAVNSLTVNFSRELAPSIRVNAIQPSSIPTEVVMDALGLTEADLPAFAERKRIPLGRLGRPADVAGVTVFLCSPAAAWITGEVWTVSGGL
ncbi:MAG: glucose 1-dehydrogenase [Alphaproteobacteria bacterium]|nr:glucose 1-dehydrogenase [Alphaproteobacteria bacterium]